MAKKIVKNNKMNIDKLPNDKSVVYKIKTDGGKVNYVGIAKSGRVQEQLKKHLLGGKYPVPGTRNKEAAVIKPKHNEQGK